MHADDPVQWKTWGGDIVEKARQSGRLLFVSIGYFSCHWCHVMHGESYTDAGIAELLNDHFIPVKVDRELQPALDTELVHFVQLTRGYAGWPLNVLITPDGHPLLGFTYLPRQDFERLLRRVAERWSQDSEGLRQLAREAAAAIAATRPPPNEQPLTPAGVTHYNNAFVAQAMEAADPIAGGFGRDTKFAFAPQLRFLLELEARQDSKRLEEFLELTFTQMHRQGLRDQLGGGFFRYTTDREWQIPHFEKMLYDNALLAELYLDAAERYHQPVFAEVGRDTLDFMLRELRSPDGGFFSSLSAVDASGVEGGYYLWSTSQLRELLSPREMEIARLAWRLSGTPALEQGYLPVQAHSADQIATRLGVAIEEVHTGLESSRNKLLRARAGRRVPVDSKILASWNGLALSALTAAAGLEGGERYALAARALRDYLVTELWDGTELVRARGARGSIGTVSLEDYAFVARGLLAWAGFTDKPEDYAVAGAIVEQAWRRFYSTSGWQVSERAFLAADPREPVLSDTVLPSPSAVLVETTIRLSKRVPAPDVLGQDIRRALSAQSAGLAATPFDYPTQLALASRHLR
jgi:uncharacterized protein YyaL (SSP411 family)